MYGELGLATNNLQSFETLLVLKPWQLAVASSLLQASSFQAVASSLLHAASLQAVVWQAAGLQTVASANGNILKHFMYYWMFYFLKIIECSQMIKLYFDLLCYKINFKWVRLKIVFNRKSFF